MERRWSEEVKRKDGGGEEVDRRWRYRSIEDEARGRKREEGEGGLTLAIPYFPFPSQLCVPSCIM